jgi:integrase
MQTWSGAQVRAFLDSVDNNRLRGCWWLLANTGIRRGEVLGCAGRTSTSTPARFAS